MEYGTIAKRTMGQTSYNNKKGTMSSMVSFPAEQFHLFQHQNQDGALITEPADIIPKQGRTDGAPITKPADIVPTVSSRWCPDYQTGRYCSKTPMESRDKRLSVPRLMKEKCREILERITAEYGTQLRMNRSIQVKGSLAVIKEEKK